MWWLMLMSSKPAMRHCKASKEKREGGEEREGGKT